MVTKYYCVTYDQKKKKKLYCTRYTDAVRESVFSALYNFVLLHGGVCMVYRHILARITSLQVCSSRVCTCIISVCARIACYDVLLAPHLQDSGKYALLRRHVHLQKLVAVVQERTIDEKPVHHHGARTPQRLVGRKEDKHQKGTYSSAITTTASA